MSDQAVRDELAAAIFPVEWPQWANASGAKARRRRHNMRVRAEYIQKVGVLRAAGASCASCSSFSKHPHAREQMVCDAGCDFHGYQLATPGGICPDWSARP